VTAHAEIPTVKSRQESRPIKKDSPSGRVAKVPQPGKGKSKEKEKAENSSVARMDTIEATGLSDKDMSETPDLNDPTYAKYLNRFQMLVHSCLTDMADKVAAVLSSSSEK